MIRLILGSSQHYYIADLGYYSGVLWVQRKEARSLNRSNLFVGDNFVHHKTRTDSLHDFHTDYCRRNR